MNDADEDGEGYAEVLTALHRIAVAGDEPGLAQIRRWLGVGMAAVGAGSGLVLTGTGLSAKVLETAGAPVAGAEVGVEIADHRVDDVLRRRATVVILHGGSATSDRLPTDLGPGGLVLSPLWVDGDAVGVVAFVTGEQHVPFPSWPLALVDLVADGIARVLEQSSTDAGEGEGEGEPSPAQVMLDLIPDLVVRMTRSGHPVEGRFGAEGAAGADPFAGIGGGHDAEADAMAKLRAGIAEALAQGSLHTMVFTSGGGVRARSVEVRIVPAGDDEVLCISRDVTARHRADLQASVFESIARSEPVEAVLGGALDLLQDHLGRSTVVVLTVDGDHLTLAGDHREHAWAGWFADLPLDLANPYGQAVSTGEQVAVGNVERDARFTDHLVPEAGYRSLVVHPVRSSRHARVLGLLVVLGRDVAIQLVGDEVDTSVTALVTVALEREADTRLLAHQATHDPLTGAGNRAALLDRLQLVLARARRSGDPVAVLFCDLDGFKEVNDRHGHLGGDQVLVEVASRLRGAVRPSDTVCRAGGDEFVVVCEDLGDPAQADEIAERVIAAVVSSPIPVGDAELRISVSVGVALADPVLDDPDRILHRADQDMYRRKQSGRA